MSATISTASSNVIHEVCGSCGRVLFCSAAEPWYPQREWGWCWCALGHPAEDGEDVPDGCPEVVATAPNSVDHRCGPEYGQWVKDASTDALYWVQDGVIAEGPQPEATQ